MQKTKPSPKRRWLTACLWSIAGILLLGVLAATVLNIVDWRMRKTSTQDSTYPLGGTTVSLTHFAVGNIRIVAGATDTVTVHSIVKQGIHKLGLTAQHTATGLAIRQTGSCDTSYGLLSPCSASYVLTVPTDTTLIADTGNVTLSVAGVHGNHQLSVNDGNVTVSY